MSKKDNKSKVIRARVSEEEYKEFNDFAKSLNMDLSEVVRRALRGSIQRQKKTS